MKNKLLVMLSVLLVVLGVTVTSVAQDDLPEGWPEGCQLPDLEAAMNAANEAQADRDVAAFVDSMSEMNQVVDNTLGDCLEAVVTDDIDLSDTELWGVNLWGANLGGANLQRARLMSAYLVGANLDGANLQRAYLAGTNLEWASLINANLQGAYLHLFKGSTGCTNLQSANLHNANLQATFLGCVNLRGANLSGSNLQAAGLTETLFHEYTMLPDGTHWTPDTDMARFTDPEHPDFWNPCVELDSPPWYCEDGDE